MFFGNDKVTAAKDQGGLGINWRTNSDLFDWFKDNLQKRTEEIDIAKLAGVVRGPWQWHEATRTNYPTSHDEAANRRDGATGAYLASLLKGDDGSWPYVERKTKLTAAAAMFFGTAYMDMPQMRLLQEGSFYSNPGVQWDLRYQDSQRKIRDFLANISWTVKDNEAFGIQNFHPNVENHYDDANKVISGLRVNFRDGKKYYAIFNFGHNGITNYTFGVDSTKNFRIIVDSDRSEFNGSHELARRLPQGTLPTQSWGAHGKPRSLQIPYLAPLSTVWLVEE